MYATLVSILAVAALGQTGAPPKPTVAVVYATSCEACALLEKAEGIQLVRYDLDRGEGQGFVEAFKVDSVPTVVVFTPDGTVLDRISGRSSEQLDALLTIAKVSGSLSDKGRSLDARLLLIAGLRALREGDLTRGEELLDRAAQLDADNLLRVRDLAVLAALRARYFHESGSLKAKWLLEVARKAPASDEAVSALAALAAQHLPFDVGQMRAVANGVRQALEADERVEALTALMQAQVGLNDADGALLTKQGLQSLGPGEGHVQRSPRDPLAPEPVALLSAAQLEVDALEKTLRETCRAQAKSVKTSFLRFSVEGGKVTRALAFDVETPPGLKKCLESTAMRQTMGALESRSSSSIQLEF